MATDWQWDLWLGHGTDETLDYEDDWDEENDCNG